MNPSANASDPVLVLLAHGSPDPDWQRPFTQLHEALQADYGQSRIRLAYMEFVGPALDETVKEAIDEGHRRVRVLPLFMAAGGHFKNDIVPMVDGLNERYAEATVELLEPVGEHPRLVAALRDIVGESL